jgi:glycosyltransferase involved in cell wall biosynthesis
MEGKGTQQNTGRPDAIKILALHTNTGSRYYRIIPQLRFMQRQGHQVRLERHDVQNLDQFIDWADVVILQMVFSEDLVKQIKAKGKKVIFECDDLIHRTHEKHYAYDETNTLRKQIGWLWRIWNVLRRCDGFIVSTPELKKVYGFMAKRTFVFPNYMELEHWLKEPKRNQTDRVRILWAGSTSHTGDLEWVKPIIGTILEKYPQVQFIYMGHGGVPTDDLYAKFIYGDDVFEGLPIERRESLLPAPPNVYPYLLAATGADIAIAPLEENYFNRFKTQCKYLEYAINGIPGVYSGWFYKDVKDYRAGLPYTTADATGLLADTPEEWIQAISLLVEDATLRRQIGERARREVIEEYSFADHAPAWQGFVEKITHGPTHPQRPRTS